MCPFPESMLVSITEQKMKFFIKDFFSKCDQIHSILRIWSHLLKKFLMKNFIFYSLYEADTNRLSHQRARF